MSNIGLGLSHGSFLSPQQTLNRLVRPKLLCFCMTLHCISHVFTACRVSVPRSFHLSKDLTAAFNRPDFQQKLHELGRRCGKDGADFRRKRHALVRTVLS